MGLLHPTPLPAELRQQSPPAPIRWHLVGLLAVVGAGGYAYYTNHVWGTVLAAVLVVLVIAAVIAWRQMLPYQMTHSLMRLRSDVDRPWLQGLPQLQWSKLRWRRGVWTVAWRMPLGHSSSILLQQTEAVSEHHNCSAHFWHDNGLHWMRAGTKRVPDFVPYARVYGTERRGLPFIPPAGELVFSVGDSSEGRLWRDLGQIHNLKTAGSKGGGKTGFLRQLVMWLAESYDSRYLRLVLIDLSWARALAVFDGLPHLLAPVATELDDALAALRTTEAEMKRKQALLSGSDTIADYNRKHPADPMPYILLIVDEAAEMAPLEATDKERQRRTPAALALNTRLRNGRKSGDFTVLAAQRPTREVVPGQQSANIDVTLAFKCADATHSRTVLGEDSARAATLPPIPGRGILSDSDGREILVQTPWISREETEARVEKLRSQRRDAVPTLAPVIALPASTLPE
jgi:hypothetical protein